MNTRQNLTATEWKIVIRTSLGTLRTEWRASREAAEALREKYDVQSIELAERILDY